MTQAPASAPMGSGGGPGGGRPHRGGMILTFGILGIVLSCCIVGLIFGIVAWVMGNGDLKSMQAGQMDSSGEGMTNAGKICGIIGVALAIINVIVNILYVVFVGAALWSSGGMTP